jgi:hypothetical protein
MEILKIAIGVFIGTSAGIGFVIAIIEIVEYYKNKKENGK